MNAVQFERFKDFALRMTFHGWPEATEARKQRLYDEVSEVIEMWVPYAADITGWDTGDNDTYACDWLDEWAAHRHDHYWLDGKEREHERRNRFYVMIRCCLRAALDVAAEPSAGVMGFDVGTIRRMYDGQVPDWIDALYEGQLATAPNDAGVWL